MNWPAWYELRVAERFEEHWGPCFAERGLTPVSEPGGVGALLRGQLRDPAELFGALARVRDLNLTLLEVRRMEG
jgi:hypothetical protein